MYSVKTFKVSKSGSMNGALSSVLGGKSAYTDSGMKHSIYQQIADYANKNNLEVVKISDEDETLMGKVGITVLFKKGL